MTRRLPTSSRPGFTLLELVISVALVLVLMLAITRIFAITSTAIGASQGFAAATRDARSAQAVFSRDMNAMAFDTPFVLIRSDLPTPAFRNEADDKADTDNGTAAGKLTVDLDGNGIEGEAAVPGEVMGPYDVTVRNHRLDRFSFCARDRYARQTGNGGATGTLVAPMNSPEAWISYGHLTLPDGSGNYTVVNDSLATTDPGQSTATVNPQNYYASQWILGRVAMLMLEPSAGGSGNYTGTTATTIKDSNGTTQVFYPAGSTAYPATQPVAPFATGSTATNGTALATARYDLVGTSISGAAKILNKQVDWYTRVFSQRFQADTFLTTAVADTTGGTSANPDNYKINAQSASRLVPVFIPACSQFIVEYAGDFVSQVAANGTLDTAATHGGLTPDGQIDYHYDATTGTRQIQWYGLPRLTNPNAPGRPATAAGRAVLPAYGDVVTLGQFVHYISGGTNYPTPASLQTYPAASSTTSPNTSFAVFEHYATVNSATSTTDNPALPFSATDSYSAAPGYTFYSAAWGPDSINNPDIPRPKMIRITLVIDRPELAGRTQAGQTFEYVFNTPF